MGPFSASTSGRVGVNAGPIGLYGGGRRRRSGGGGGSFFGLLLAVGIVIFVVMWPLSLWGHAIHLTPSWHQLMNRDKAWLHEHYPLIGLRYVGAGAALLATIAAIAVGINAATAPERARQAERTAAEQAAREHERQLAYQRWLDAPPPPFRPPARFTQAWLEDNVPDLHPGQVPMLLAELRARGWNDARIAQRVTPLLPATTAIAHA
jgi:hypothetical protein